MILLHQGEFGGRDDPVNVSRHDAVNDVSDVKCSAGFMCHRTFG